MTTALMQTVTSFEETIKADETVGPVVKEIERSMFFTDVPDCGAMKFHPHCASVTTKEGEDEEGSDDVVSKTVMNLCGSMERAFCFTDLEDVKDEDIERLRSMKSLQEGGGEEEVVTTKEGAAAATEQQPVVDTDTESMSDDSATNNNTATTTITEKPEDSPAVKAVKAAAIAATTDQLLPPKNAFQSSSTNRKGKNGKPLNAMQAAKQAKKAEKEAKKLAKAAEKAKNNKKKGWGLFRKSGTTKAAL